ncbi:MAG: hypothetical protein KC493_03640 [Bacteriovoracaceae bacterium]|nr:hypothetical protein [Bacteriovoracaceae bacterium]
MTTRTFIFKVKGMDDPSRLRMAQNALFRELFVEDMSLSKSKERLTLKIQENSLDRAHSILSGLGHNAEILKPMSAGVEGIFY